MFWRKKEREKKETERQMKKSLVLMKDFFKPFSLSPTAIQFLHSTSTIIHFEDFFLHLSDFYFMDPDWVREAVLRLFNKQHLFVDAGILSIQASKALYGEDIGLQEEFRAFLALLEKGHTVFLIGAGHAQQYLVTFALPKQRPVVQVRSFSPACMLLCSCV